VRELDDRPGGKKGDGRLGAFDLWGGAIHLPKKEEKNGTDVIVKSSIKEVGEVSGGAETFAKSSSTGQLSKLTHIRCHPGVKESRNS